jgi:hypothetical protein
MVILVECDRRSGSSEAAWLSDFPTLWRKCRPILDATLVSIACFATRSQCYQCFVSRLAVSCNLWQLYGHVFDFVVLQICYGVLTESVLEVHQQAHLNTKDNRIVDKIGAAHLVEGLQAHSEVVRLSELSFRGLLALM